MLGSIRGGEHRSVHDASKTVRPCTLLDKSSVITVRERISGSLFVEHLCIEVPS